ncbi:MAG: UTP--glucose-1-phosphate uridylyltransferase [Planctomycetota bacterium]
MPISKVVIPAAGFGTRMLPAAKSVPKEMLPVLNKPAIQYVVEEAIAAQAGDICFVVSGDKKAIEDHFDTHADLERRLEEKGRSDWLESVAAMMRNARLFSVRQREQLGLGHAVLQAENHVGDEPFLCMLGDTIFSGIPAAKQLVEAQAQLGGSVIGLERVPAEKVSRYGIAGGTMLGAQTMRIESLVEKPVASDAPSDLAIAARYVLSPRIFTLLHETPRGKGGEIQLTDALQQLVREETVHGIVLEGTRHDIGNPTDWLRTNLLFARQDDALWNELAPTLRTLLDT